MFGRTLDHAGTKISPRSSLRFSLLLLASLLIQFAHAPNVRAQTDNEPRNTSEITTLESGKPVERELSGGQKHTYQLALTEGQFANVTVEQRGIDVAVRLLGLDGMLITEFDFESRNQGQEKIGLVAQAAGNYRIEIVPTLKCAGMARYEIRLNEVRAATERDRSLYEAAKSFTEATRLNRAQKINDALPLAESAAQIFQQNLGSENPEFARALQLVASLYSTKKDFTKAGPLFQQALEIRERILGSDHPDVAASLHAMAIFYHDKGELDKAEDLAKRALALRERVLDPNHFYIGYTLLNYGSYLFEATEYAKAKNIYERAADILGKSLGEDHPFYLSALHSVAFQYDSLADFTRAEEAYQRELTAREKVAGKDGPQTPFVLSYLARVKKRVGDYDAAEALYQRMFEISEKLKDENNSLVALANLAGVYADRGDYLRAEEIYKEILMRRENAAKPNQMMIANTLVNLGVVSNSKGDYVSAEAYLKRCLSILAEIQEGETLELADTLTILATTYIGKADYTTAEEVSRHALAIDEKLTGPGHPFVARALSRLGRISYLEGDYVNAESTYLRALSIIEKSEGPNGQDIADPLTHLALIYAARNDVSRSLEFQTRADTVDERRVTLALATGSEHQKLNYMIDSATNRDRNLTLSIQHAPTSEQASELALLTVLRFKGRVLDAMADTFSVLRRRATREDQALLDQLSEANTQLARRILYASTASQSAETQAQTTALEERRDKLEDEISRRSAEFRAQTQLLTLDGIRQTIPDGAALVEFAIYRPVKEKATTAKAEYSEPRYVAYVLRQRGEVRWTELGGAKEIDARVAQLREALRDPQQKDVQQLARSLDKKVMQPVRALLGDATQLLVSPDGELNLVPFASLVDEQGRYLIQRYSFTYLTSGRDLLRMQVARESQSGPLIVANPTFGEQVRLQSVAASPNSKHTQRDTKRRSITSTRSLSDTYFAPLDGTETEARSIQTLFPDAIVLTGVNATETAVKQAEAPRILHLATHGFFLFEAPPVAGESDVSAPKTRPGGTSPGAASENPLLRSGLALAGANLRNGNGDDGILTALEASGLNLWGTKLVVLSACDTGVGEVRTGEGVYGLRRAFTLAGAESLVMSLWPISDFTTRTLMTSYYQNLKAGMGRGEALRQVQLGMLKKNPKLHPFYWANFIQAGDWASLDGKR